MKLFTFLVGLVCLYPTVSHAHEIAIVSGTPDMSVTVVANVVKEIVDLAHVKPEQFYTTAIVSIFGMTHYAPDIRDVAAISVADSNGTCMPELFEQGLIQAAQRAPVVYTNMNGDDSHNKSLCDLMSKFSNVAFVITAGNDSLDKSGSLCGASNVLIAADLNGDRTGLQYYSNWGNEVRIATGSSLSVVVPGGFGGAFVTLDNSGLGSALIAARLAMFAKQYPKHLGARLIDLFLEGNTVTQPELAGKVKDGLVLKALSL